MFHWWTLVMTGHVTFSFRPASIKVKSVMTCVLIFGQENQMFRTGYRGHVTSLLVMFSYRDLMTHYGNWPHAIRPLNVL